MRREQLLEAAHVEPVSQARVLDQAVAQAELVGDDLGGLAGAPERARHDGVGREIQVVQHRRLAPLSLAALGRERPQASSPGQSARFTALPCRRK